LSTFIPEDPEELASVVGFLAAHERLRGTVASPGYALVGAEEHDRNSPLSRPPIFLG
jgi:hypothetical protein